jgi:hypothetical protein
MDDLTPDQLREYLEFIYGIVFGPYQNATSHARLRGVLLDLYDRDETLRELIAAKGPQNAVEAARANREQNLI